MISSVVSAASTVSTVSAVSSFTSAGDSVAAGLGLVATLVLIAMLIVKELSGARMADISAGGAVTLSRVFERATNVAIVPLLVVFGFTVLVNIMKVLH